MFSIDLSLARCHFGLTHDEFGTMQHADARGKQEGQVQPRASRDIAHIVMPLSS